MTGNEKDDESPKIDHVLDTLGDEDSRTIIEELTEPMTADELAKACDIPSSTVYQKLDDLRETALLHERTEIRPDGHHASRYELAFDTLYLTLDENHALSARAERPKRTGNRRLSEMWSEIRRGR